MGNNLASLMSTVDFEAVQTVLRPPSNLTLSQQYNRAVVLMMIGMIMLYRIRVRSPNVFAMITLWTHVHGNKTLAELFGLPRLYHVI